MARLSFREQVLRVREDAIVDAVNRLLAEKGFDLMTVDEVAAEVGIAKASLYRHFASKEALAAAAMLRLMREADAVTAGLAARELSPAARLREAARWALRRQIAGEMPSLPSQNSSLRAELLGNKDYLELLMRISECLGGWIVQAQAEGEIDPALPPELVLYTVYARACDPVPAFLKAGGAYEDEQIVELVLGACFDGLRRRAT